MAGIGTGFGRSVGKIFKSPNPNKELESGVDVQKVLRGSISTAVSVAPLQTAQWVFKLLQRIREERIEQDDVPHNSNQVFTCSTHGRR